MARGDRTRLLRWLADEESVAVGQTGMSVLQGSVRKTGLWKTLGEGTTRGVVSAEKKRKGSWRGVRKETQLPMRTGENRA